MRVQKITLKKTHVSHKEAIDAENGGDFLDSGSKKRRQ